MSKIIAKSDFNNSFVNFTIRKIKSDNGLAAALRRADNPATEYQCWEHLASFKIDIEKDYRRLPFTMVCAGLAKNKVEMDGPSGIGACISSCYSRVGSADGTQGHAKLRRLLACNSVEEVCGILRGLLSLIGSKSTRKLCYVQLLKDLQQFHFCQEDIKARWAQDYYSAS